jgi:hypothetical protein
MERMDQNEHYVYANRRPCLKALAVVQHHEVGKNNKFVGHCTPSIGTGLATMVTILSNR